MLNKINDCIFQYLNRYPSSSNSEIVSMLRKEFPEYTYKKDYGTKNCYINEIKHKFVSDFMGRFLVEVENNN